MSGSTNTYSVVATMFLERYKQYILQQYRSLKDGAAAQALLQSNDFAKQLYGLAKKQCHIYDNPAWQSAVLETLDLNTIYSNIDGMPKSTEDEYVDNLVKELLRYFKQDFFKWVNTPDCQNCGPNTSDQMQPLGGQRPCAEEARFDCGVVELYKCNRCNNVTRFPRYGDPIKLLETKRGRCGEWANLFTLILKSFGLETRYVWNREDHVWCEFYSPNLKRWVHLDPCEQAFDEPRIYSVNWNKKMSYCIAFSSDGVTDVSKRYILQNQLPRDCISEQDLRLLCSYMTKQLRASMTNEEIYKLAMRDEQETLQYLQKGRELEANKSTTESIPSKVGSNGRISGSAEWKAKRGEDGT